MRDVQEGLAELLAHLLSVVVNEETLQVRMERFFVPTPASLATDDDNARRLNDRLETLAESLGGPPRLIIVKEDGPKPRYDTYPVAAISELLSAFHTSRRLVCKAHSLSVAVPFLRANPDVWDAPLNPEEVGNLLHALERRYWEEVEYAYIRLAAFWDRAGQLLDFAFFNIRQYERDGFASVVDRVRQNAVPMNADLRECPAWLSLWAFRKSEQADGLTWLLRRRNLLVHSLHLRSNNAGQVEDPIFESAYNHLDIAVQEKLRQGTVEQELASLHAQLAKAASGVGGVAEVALFAPKIKGKLIDR